ncbi:MAG: hypothetical protein JO184_18245 [Gammaproteobacteria bacterium]|nr:hypothetical protein [Gammaproteobacteria bacterium]MBV8306117.1 hypothetical protein [Gammaproteobacteria bacterium]
MARRLARTALATTVLLSAAGAASATVTEYTDQSAYSAATSNSSTFTFNGLSPPGSFELGDLSDGGLSFSGSGAQDIGALWNSGFFYGGRPFFTSTSLAPGIAAAELMCTLSGAEAIGFVYGDYADAGGAPFTVTLSTGDSFVLSTPPVAGFDTGFVGFVSNTPITSVTFSDNGKAFDLLQVERSSGSTVGAPEPAPLGLMAFGLLYLAVFGRSRAQILTGKASRPA